MLKKTFKVNLNDLENGINNIKNTVNNIDVDNIKNNITNIKDTAVEKVQNMQIDINIVDALKLAMKIPASQIDRELFLRKELKSYFNEDIVNLSISKNPASAGIDREFINNIADNVISYETKQVTTLSALAGMPGGLAMLATVPADVSQFFVFVLRVIQKLAYLYGFEDFKLSEDEISDDVMAEILTFLGIMFGVQEANKAIKIIAKSAAERTAKQLSRQALTKGVVYPIVKKIATIVGIKMNKQIFAKAVSGTIPLLGGAISGTLTFVTFKPNAKKLRDKFTQLPLSDPDFYKNPEEIIIDIDEIE